VAIVGDVIEREISISAPPEAVFPYFTEPDLLIRWKGVEAKLDPTPGGVYRVDVDGSHVAVGEYVVVDPPSRVVFTWGWEGSESTPPGSSTVEVTLEAVSGGTRVRLVHRDLPVEALPDHETGWEHYCERFALAASGGDPGPDPWAAQQGDGRP
jgi:uncharacterized protein YndB with AHSA1/START domain